MLIKKHNQVFDVNVEATKEYYKNVTLCDCSACRNYYAQVKDKLPLLCDFLAEFGVDISKPDELSWIGAKNEINYLFAAYTVTGRMADEKRCEFQIDDSLLLDVVIEKGYVPNEQTGEYFVINVYNISLPWVMDEPFP